MYKELKMKERPKWDWEPERLIFKRTRENKIREKENKKISNRVKKKVQKQEALKNNIKAVG